MGVRADDHGRWVRPGADGQSTPTTATDTPAAVPSRPRARFWPVVAVAALATAGLGFALGRSTDTQGASPDASRPEPTAPPTVTINGVTPPAPPPADDPSAPESARPIVSVLEVDQRVVGPTKLVAATTLGLFEIDLNTGKAAQLTSEEPGGERNLVAGNDWVVTSDDSTLLVQRDPAKSLVPITRSVDLALWSNASDLGWAMRLVGTTRLRTTWQQVNLDGEVVTTVAVPGAAAVVGVTSNGLVAGYRGSIYLFNGAGARWIATGEPIAANSDSIVIHVCERSTTCELIVVDGAGKEQSSTPLEQPIPIRMYVGGSDSSLSPDATKLLVLANQDGSRLERTPTGFWVVDLVSGSTLWVALAASDLRSGQITWTPDGGHVVAVVNGKAEVVDTITGEQFPLAADNVDLARLGEWTGVTTRP